eukprot:scaffold5290_cov116-Isochrysis_galbana.AAC.2
MVAAQTDDASSRAGSSAGRDRESCSAARFAVLNRSSLFHAEWSRSSHVFVGTCLSSGKIGEKAPEAGTRPTTATPSVASAAIRESPPNASLMQASHAL